MLQSEAQKRGQAGVADLVSSDGMSTKTIDKAGQGKHAECGERRARLREECWEMLAWESSDEKGAGRSEVWGVGRRLKEYGRQSEERRKVKEEMRKKGCGNC